MTTARASESSWRLISEIEMRELKHSEIEAVNGGFAPGDYAAVITAGAIGTTVAGPFGGFIGAVVGFGLSQVIRFGVKLSGPVGVANPGGSVDTGGGGPSPDELKDS